MNFEPAEAMALAERLNGYGPNMYLRDVREWQNLLGDDNGQGVYVMLLVARRKKGVIPKGFKMNHGYRTRA